jgi:hypothetical protein
MAFEWGKIADDVAGQLGARADVLERIRNRVTEHARGTRERRSRPQRPVASPPRGPGDVSVGRDRGAERDELAAGPRGIERGASRSRSRTAAWPPLRRREGIVEVAGGRTFEIKRDQARRLGPVPFRS